MDMRSRCVIWPNSQLSLRHRTDGDEQFSEQAHAKTALAMLRRFGATRREK